MDVLQYTLKEFYLWRLRNKLDILNDNEILRLTDGKMSFVDKFEK